MDTASTDRIQKAIDELAAAIAARQVEYNGLLAACEEVLFYDAGTPPWSIVYHICRAAVAKARGD